MLQDGKTLGVEGLIGILKKFAYPQRGIHIDAVEEELLRFSNAIRLEDDLTFIAARFR